MATPKVSVVIPVYNGARYIEESVHSVLNQTLNEVEVIIVDDGSTDNTNLVLEQLQKNDSRISVIRQENKGQGTARNSGLGRTRGEAVVFLDGDDYYGPEALETVYAELLNTGCEIIIFNGRAFIEDETGQITWKDNNYFSLTEKDAGRIRTGLEFIERTGGRIQSPCMKI